LLADIFPFHMRFSHPIIWVLPHLTGNRIR
jgi:hypothetical protein